MSATGVADRYNTYSQKKLIGILNNTKKDKIKAEAQIKALKLKIQNINAKRQRIKDALKAKWYQELDQAIKEVENGEVDICRTPEEVEAYIMGSNQ